MKTLKKNNCWCFVVLLISLLFLLPGARIVNGAGVPSPEDVVAYKAPLPTIEDLTGGKVKKGDIIDKNNLDLVKDFLSPGCAEAIKQGLVLVMGTNANPDKGVPKAYVAATKKNLGKAIIAADGTVYYETVGTPWPGGLPFPTPKNGQEVMANTKWGIALDDFRTKGVLRFVNSKGEVYKNVGMSSIQVWCNTRTLLEPLGTVPGYEKQMYRRISTLTFPIELKGQGSFNVRYYNDVTDYDTGFMYFPSFKRTLRVSTTTYQDNIAGSDLTRGDSQGLNEPYADWNFKLLETKFMLIPEHRAPFPYFDNGKVNPKLQWDVGHRFPRMGWAIFPIHVVEAVPKSKHVYGKKLLNVASAPYIPPAGVIEMVDIFDRQGKLWKFYCPHNGDYDEKWESETPWGVFMTDLQTQHSTQFWFKLTMNANEKPRKCSFKTLLKMSR